MSTPHFSLPAIFDNPMGWGPPAAAKRTPSVRSSKDDFDGSDHEEDGDHDHGAAAKATIAFLDGMAPPSAESERAAAAQAATFAAAIGPFGPFSRFDKLGRIVDWTASSANTSHSFQQNQKSSWKSSSHHTSSNNTNAPGLGLSTNAFERRTEEDDKDFTLVDSKAASRPRMNYNQFRFRKFQPIAAAQAVRRASTGAQSAPSAPAAAPQNRPAAQRTANTGGGSAWGRGNTAQRVVAAGMAGQPSQNRQQRAPTTQRGNAQQRPAAGKPGFNRFPMNGLNNRRFEQSGGKLPSVDISESWKLEKEIDFNTLSSTLSYPLESEDLVTAGTLEKYVIAYNNVNARLPKVLQRFENRQFFVATTSEDPVLQRLSSENKGEVYATEAILSVLMAAFKSNASFDIIVKKENGKIFFDNRPNGRIDYVNVNEGILDNPAAAAEPDGVNHPVQLSEEATFINHNFSQCIVKGEPKALDEANPFLSGLHDGHEPASTAFRYRRFKLADGVNVIARTAVNGYSATEKGDSFIMARALNEYDPKLTQVDWRQKLDSQPGAVLAAEMKLHMFKFARWASEAQLCGADEIRVGFVSRENFKSSYRHSILKVSKFTQNEFSKAMNVQVRQLWGSLRAIIDSCQQLADGKYLLIRDPNKTAINIYAVPTDVSLDEIVDASSAASSANQNA